jgi:hypothetical protein
MQQLPDVVINACTDGVDAFLASGHCHEDRRNADARFYPALTDADGKSAGKAARDGTARLA